MIKFSDKALIEFHCDDKQVSLSVRLDAQDETVWLNLNQIALLFQRDKSVIAKHLRKLFKFNELDRNSTVAKFATVQVEGERQVTRDTEFFNLDAILAVGYRVNSQKGSEFRRWSSQALKEYLIIVNHNGDGSGWGYKDGTGEGDGRGCGAGQGDGAGEG